MTESSAPWDSTSTGDASSAPYDAATKFASILEGVSGTLALAGRGGVLRGARNSLVCTPGSGKVTIGTGEALVYGTKYVNDAAQDLTGITTPSSSTRVDRIVLRKSWSLQTVRLTRIVGVEGAGVPALGAGTPLYTQTAGTTWDTPLYQISTTTGGVISIAVDERVYVPVHGDQSGESGTKIAYTGISGRPGPLGSVTTIIPGAAGTAGVSSSYSAGDHQHPLAADPGAIGLSNILAGTGGVTDSELQITLPTLGNYYVMFAGAFQLNTATGFVFSINAGATALGYTAVGPNTTDYLVASTTFNSGGPFGNVAAGASNLACSAQGFIYQGSGLVALYFAGIGGNVFRVAGSVLYARRIN